MRLGSQDWLRLKQPFGVLIKQGAISRDLVLAIIKGAPKVITVGDATTQRLVDEDIVPNVAIVDGRERRRSRQTPAFPASSILKVSNPAGSISPQAIDAIRTVLETESRAKIIVKGEEDLLVLPVCVYAPLGSAVLYGQPLEGMVIVEVTREKKRKAQEFMEKLISCKSV